MYYVYVLKSLKDKKLYLGFSGDLKERFKKHHNGKVAATKFRRPLALVYYEAYSSEKDARERERQLKQYGNAYSQLKRRIKNSISTAY